MLLYHIEIVCDSPVHTSEAGEVISPPVLPLRFIFSSTVISDISKEMLKFEAQKLGWACEPISNKWMCPLCKAASDKLGKKKRAILPYKKLR